MSRGVAKISRVKVGPATTEIRVPIEATLDKEMTLVEPGEVPIGGRLAGGMTTWLPEPEPAVETLQVESKPKLTKAQRRKKRKVINESTDNSTQV